MSWLDLPFAGDFTEEDLPDGLQVDELGVEIPDLQDLPDEEFDVTPSDLFFESLASNLRGVQAPRPRNFWEGLAVGGVQGLAGRGARTMSAREKFEKSKEARRKAIDESNKQATLRYKTERGGELRARRGQGRINARADAQEAARLERESVQVTPEMVAAHPELQGIKRVPVAKWIEIQTPKEKKDSNEPLVLVQGANGPIYVRRSDALGKAPPTKAPAPKRATAAEKGALAFYQRMKSATDAADARDEKGRSLEDKIAKSNIVKQGQGRFLPSALQSSDQQVYRQAQMEFITALLRRESGAAISQGEFNSYANQFFAQPGDKPAKIAAKKKARAVALEGVRNTAGPAFKEYYEGAPDASSMSDDELREEFERMMGGQ